MVRVSGGRAGGRRAAVPAWYEANTRLDESEQEAEECEALGRTVQSLQGKRAASRTGIHMMGLSGAEEVPSRLLADE